MDCLDDQTVLDLVAGTLPADAVARVDAHLDRCEHCRELLVGMHRADRPEREEPRAPQPGHRFSRFALLEPLGAGAMGVVYAAYDPELDRRVALKVLTLEASAATTRARLLAEAQAMAKLSHPNVVTIYDVGTTGETVFIAMELIDGPTLRAWAADTSRSWQRIRDVCVQAGHGLAAAHAAGLVHRDYKPDNVIVGRDRTRVGDFGLATGVALPTHESGGDTAAVPVDRPLTQTGAVVGTPAYMSPEQLRGDRPTAASDQFSFCVATFEALYGVRPFAADSLGGLSEAMERSRPQAPPGGDVPRWLLQALQRGMSPNPGERFPSIDALLGALQRDRAARTGLQIAGVAGLVAVVSVGAYTLGAAAPAVDEMTCDGGAAEIAEIWGPERAAVLTRALAAVRPAYGGAVGASVGAQVTRWTERWSAQHDQLCEATAAGLHSAAQLDARSACLVAGKRALAAHVAQWIDAPDSAVDGMSEAVETLPDPAACADARAFETPTPPGDPELAAAVAEVRHDAAAVRALVSTRDAERARARATGLLAAAKATGYAPVIAEAWLVVAASARQRGALEEARDAAYEALWAAQPSRHDRLAAQAWIALLQVAGAAGRYGDAPRLGRHGAAALERVGTPPALEAPFRNSLGIAYDNLGRREDARRALKRALELRRGQFGEQSSEAARVLTNLGNLARNERRHDDALALHRAALDIDRTNLGEGHPMIGTHLHNVARVLLLTGARDEALDHYTRALAIKQAAYGEEHVEVARTHNSLGLLFAADGTPDRAAQSFERALAIYRALHHAEEGVVRLNLGLQQLATGEAAGALVSFDDAAEIIEAHSGPGSRRFAEVTLARADALRAMDRRADARESYRRARLVADALHDEVLLERAHAGLAAVSTVDKGASTLSGFGKDKRPGRGRTPAGRGRSRARGDTPAAETAEIAPPVRPDVAPGSYAAGAGIDEP